MEEMCGRRSGEKKNVRASSNITLSHVKWGANGKEPLTFGQGPRGTAVIFMHL